MRINGMRINGIKSWYYDVYDTNAAWTAFLLAAQDPSRIEVSCDDEPAVSRIIVLGFLRPSGSSSPWRSYVVRQGGVRLSPETGGTSGCVQSNPRQLWGEREGNRIRCLSRFLLTSLPAYLLFSRRFLRHGSAIERRRGRYVCLMCFPFRSARTILSVVWRSPLCLRRRLSHQRSSVSRGDPSATLLSVMRASRQARYTVAVALRHFDRFIPQLRCQWTRLFIKFARWEYRFRRVKHSALSSSSF